MRWIPSAALGVLVLALAAALAVLPRFQDSRYLQVLNAQIEAVAPQAGRAAQIDKDIDSARRRTQLLDDLRRRPKSDMDVLSELTRRLPPPTWLTLTEISPRQVVLGGEAEQAAPLLKVLDSSPLFEGSEFQSLSRIPVGEMFRIRTNREGVPASIDSNGASR